MGTADQGRASRGLTAPGVRHRMTAITDLVMLEASTTQLDDVVRVEDRYGRAGTSEP